METTDSAHSQNKDKDNSEQPQSQHGGIGGRTQAESHNNAMEENRRRREGMTAAERIGLA